jgi:hypothetical protein
MAITETRVLPPEFIEAAGKTYLEDLSKAVGGFKAADLSDVYGTQFVAPESQLQAQARGMASGLGSFEPYLQTAAARTGPDAYKDFMSPFQRDVIQTTLEDFDIQAQKGLGQIGQAAIGAGAFGGGRQGVAEAEYQAASDRNRAALQAQLLSQGFGQAQQQAGLDFARNVQLAQQAPALAGQQIAGLSTLGAQQQAQAQAGLTAQQQLAQQQLQQPLTASQTYGQGVTSLIAGYPGTTQQTSQPGPSPISTALGIGSTLAGIYRAVTPQKLTFV